MKIADALGVQLVSFTCFNDIERSLSAIAQMGFINVETIGDHLDDAHKMRGMLDSQGLVAISGHVGLPEVQQRLRWVIEQSLVLGAKEVYMPAVPPELRNSRKEFWQALGAELGEMASEFKQAGIQFGYHNHDWEFAAFKDGSYPLDYLMQGSEGSGLTWQADFSWIRRGGQNPFEWLQTYKNRLSSIHLKDELPSPFDPVYRGWCALGDGVLNMHDAIGEMTAIQPAVSWFLEHERAQDPVQFCRDSRNFVLKNFN
ncbi:sugar phosphate isomerase/epimerase [Pantoea vagans]|uniref:sugar phosphate isomerase/epimerase family protein n=1 Tax=Pantoea vagans TaxID=470934 RepID=UPI00301831E3